MSLRRSFFIFILFVIASRFSFNLVNNLNTTKDEAVAFLRVKSDENPIEISQYSDNTYIFSALPDFDEEIRTSVKTGDARPEIIRQYLKKRGSPLEPHAQLIVDLADQYHFDYRWMVAIAQQESNLCKVIPFDSYNCWGWGIYPDPTNPEVLKVTRFASYEDALRRIAPQFKKIFLKDSHFKDPSEVMKTYTPPSDGSWADGVSQFFDQLK